MLWIEWIDTAANIADPISRGEELDLVTPWGSPARSCARVRQCYAGSHVCAACHCQAFHDSVGGRSCSAALEE
eukprot:7407713-Karenia_brevis.AAC.1